MKINCDVGEGLDEIDALLLPQINMASIACGGHAGNTESMQRTVALAHHHNVSIGAHPSYPDVENFGRQSLNISSEALFASLQQQVRTLKDIAEVQGASLAFIKPHGALYNDCVTKALIRHTVLKLAETFSLPLVLQALPNIEEHAQYHSDLSQSPVVILFEAFADRAYQNNGQLVSRKHAGAVLTSLDDVGERVNNLRIHRSITSIDGKKLPLHVDTLCVHSDSRDAVPMINTITTILTSP